MEPSARASSPSRVEDLADAPHATQSHHTYRLLQDAAAAVAGASLHSGFEDLPDEVSALTASVLDVLKGREAAAVRAELPVPARRPGLQAALRAELLRLADDRTLADVAVDLIRLLVALEKLSTPAPSHLGAEHSLVPLLLEPDAFELLVEVAHDLRSPLTSILFLSETLRNGRSGRVNDVQRSQLGLIYGAALGLHSVTSDVVDLARGAREIEEEPTPFALGDVFQSVVDLVRPVAEEKGLEIHVQLPDFDRCIGRPLLLGRVLLNLATNGLKFTSEGYVELAAERTDGAAVSFSVRDTGRGIDENARSDLFEPFKTSSDRRRTFFSGAGLGLSIARRLVARMSGELEYESRPGRGTRFFFTVELPPARGV